MKYWRVILNPAIEMQDYMHHTEKPACIDQGLQNEEQLSKSTDSLQI